MVNFTMFPPGAPPECDAGNYQTNQRTAIGALENIDRVAPVALYLQLTVNKCRF